MRLAYVLERYPELSQTFVEDELRAVAAAGHDADVLALAPGDAAALADPAFVPRHPPASLRRRLAAAATLAGTRPRASAAFLARHGRWPSDGRRARALARIAAWVPAARRADVLHAHFASEAADLAGVLGRLAGRPHTFTGHSTDLFADPGGLRARLAEAALAVLVCEYDRREVERLAPGAGRLAVVPLGVDLDRLRPARGGPAPDGPVVAVGRIVAQKGFGDLVAVADAVAPRAVVLVGDGPLRAALAAAAPPNVRFTGALPRAQVLERVAGAAVLVAPSVVTPGGARDGIPMVLKEALALGVPVVASDAVGNPEVVDREHGLLHRAGDRRALAGALTTLLGRPPEERAAMGRAGRAWAERHADLRRQTAQLLDLLADVARGTGPRPGPR